MRILEFAFIAYTVTDLKKARAFYEEILGFQPASTWGDEKKGWWEYEVGPHTLAIVTENDDWKPSNQGASVALEVDDFDAAVAHLKANNVEFVFEPYASRVCRGAIIADPDGNRIGIHKRNKKDES